MLFEITFLTYAGTLRLLSSILRLVLDLHLPYTSYAYYQHLLRIHFHLVFFLNVQLDCIRHPKLSHAPLIFLNMHHVMLSILILSRCFPKEIERHFIHNLNHALIFKKNNRIVFNKSGKKIKKDLNF